MKHFKIATINHNGEQRPAILAQTDYAKALLHLWHVTPMRNLPDIVKPLCFHYTGTGNAKQRLGFRFKAMHEQNTTHLDFSFTRRLKQLCNDLDHEVALSLRQRQNP